MLLTTHAMTALAAAFLASLVEFVEALTIVLAVGTVRGWRPALAGAAAGAVLLVILVLLLGPSLALIPIAVLQLVVGVLLLLFGMRWLRKAILRAAGVIPLHDEDLIFSREQATLQAARPPAAARLDPIAFVTTFKAVLLEGVEVVFIVIAVGATGGLLWPAGLGAAAAGLLVVLLGLAIHRPLARVPENTLKFAVGLLLSAFGVFWVGEGLGLPWPGEDLAVPALVVGFLLAALAAVRLARAAPASASAGDAP
jgi:uncharacterized membrane protein